MRLGAGRLLATGFVLLSTAWPVLAQAPSSRLALNEEVAEVGVSAGASALSGDVELKDGIAPQAGEGAPAVSGPIIAREARVVGAAARTRFIMDLSGPAAVSGFMLDEP